MASQWRKVKYHWSSTSKGCSRKRSCLRETSDVAPSRRPAQSTCIAFWRDQQPQAPESSEGGQCGLHTEVVLGLILPQKYLLLFLLTFLWHRCGRGCLQKLPSSEHTGFSFVRGIPSVPCQPLSRRNGFSRR